MKTRIIFISLIALMVMTQCKTDKRNIIKAGNWTIENPMLYKFGYQTIGTGQFGPTLTVGSNGVMLAVQVEMPGSVIKGNTLDARILTSDGALKVLDKPDSGNLNTLMDVPFAIWYFEPPQKGSTISTIEVKYNSVTAMWNFTTGKQLQQ